MNAREVHSSISVRGVIVIVFILSMVFSVGLIGYLVFYNWMSSAMETTENIAEDINREIGLKIDAFMHVPEHVNEVNHKLIENGILEISDPTVREKFFVGVLHSHSNEIYSFSYATENGEYYGARRNEKG